MITRILLAACALLFCQRGVVQAETYPDRTVTIVVPAAPGGGTDLIARSMAQVLTAKWGKTVVVENRAGVGTIGAGAVAKAAPDGYTLLNATSGTVLSAALHKRMPIDFTKDLINVAYTADTPFVLVANPSVPAKDAKELIAYAKSKPGQLSFGTAGAGSLQHLAGEVFDDMAGIKMLAVPYGGSTPAFTDLLGGRINLMFLPLGSALPHIRAGKVHAIGIGSPERVPTAPDIPTITESGLPGFSVVSWQAVMVTGGSPKDVVAKLHKDIYEAVADPQIEAQMAKLKLVPKRPQSVEENQAFIQAEFKKWRPVMERLGLVR